MSNEHDQARNIVLQLLRGIDVVTSDDVSRAVANVVSMFEGMYPTADLNADALQREVEALCNVWVPGARTLVGNDDHEDWLAAERPGIEWNFWNRYERYLEQEKGWAPAQVRTLAEITDTILARFENPTRPGKWDRRGMVVGQVQSGKTANYTGLICKAADAGYRLIIVLAGLHNSLRSQTQQRLDREFLGFDTRTRLSFDQTNARVGVGAMKGGSFLHAHSLTSSNEKGDFQKKVASQVWVQAGGADPVLLVVKKNGSVLRNLFSWATDVLKETDPETGRQIVRSVPLLVIDDEADNASVNTKAKPTDEDGRPIDDYDPTKINGWIRQLLHTFEKSAYLAYTATPFANIFIDGEQKSDTYGEDLFPRSFIVSLRPPSNYTGVAKVFGLDEDVAAGIDAEAGLPVVREITDHEPWLPDGHQKDHLPGRLPGSLVEAVDAFLLSTAARRVRGQNGHNSMLVHVTRFTAVQAHVRRDLESHVELLRARIIYGDETSPESPLSRLKSLWERDFSRTTSLMLRNPDLAAEVGRQVTWQEVRSQLPDVVEALEMRTMNGTSDDSLAYTQSADPLTLIAVGGDKLSRGLTLEGLTVSYYLRASKMYDTLMQMGRWFGYRPGYLDLCRLYTTEELSGWYRDIALANEELLREFDYMAALGRTPEEYGLRVRAHPDGLMITAAAKMRNGRNVEVTFSQTISESISFDTDDDTLKRNLDAARALVAASGPAHPGPRSIRLWRDVPASQVLAFLDSYQTPDTATKARPQALAQYVRSRVGLPQQELTNWTIGLVSVESGPAFDLAGLDVGLVDRALYLPQSRQSAGAEHEADLRAGEHRYVIRRLVSPDDEFVDLTDLERERALRATVAAWHADPNPRAKQEPTRPGGLQIRDVRGPERGLLLLYLLQPRPWMNPDLPPLGFALSFPSSRSARKITYRVTNLWWEQEYGDVQ